jgi:hypothetical protein
MKWTHKIVAIGQKDAHCGKGYAKEWIGQKCRFARPVGAKHLGGGWWYADLDIKGKSDTRIFCRVKLEKLKETKPGQVARLMVKQNKFYEEHRIQH